MPLRHKEALASSSDANEAKHSQWESLWPDWKEHGSQTWAKTKNYHSYESYTVL